MHSFTPPRFPTDSSSARKAKVAQSGLSEIMMSASARNSTPAKLVAALVFAGALIVIAFGTRAHGQVGGAPHDEAPEVTAMIARVQRAPANESAPPDAILLGQQLIVERRYPEAAELFTALLGKWPRQPLALYGAALSAFNLGRRAEAEPLVRTAVEIYTDGDEDNAKPVSPEQRRRAADALVLLAIVYGSRGADSEALQTVKRSRPGARTFRRAVHPRPGFVRRR